MAFVVLKTCLATIGIEPILRPLKHFHKLEFTIKIKNRQLTKKTKDRPDMHMENLSAIHSNPPLSCLFPCKEAGTFFLCFGNVMSFIMEIHSARSASESTEKTYFFLPTTISKIFVWVRDVFPSATEEISFSGIQRLHWSLRHVISLR